MSSLMAHGVTSGSWRCCRWMWTQESGSTSIGEGAPISKAVNPESKCLLSQDFTQSVHALQSTINTISSVNKDYAARQPFPEAKVNLSNGTEICIREMPNVWLFYVFFSFLCSAFLFICNTSNVTFFILKFACIFLLNFTWLGLRMAINPTQMRYI